MIISINQYQVVDYDHQLYTDFVNDTSRSNLGTVELRLIATCAHIQGYGSTTGARIQSSSDPNKYTGYGNPEFTDNGGGSDGSSFSAVTPGTGSSRQALRPASEFQAAYRAPGKLTSRHSVCARFDRA